MSGNYSGVGNSADISRSMSALGKVKRGLFMANQNIVTLTVDQQTLNTAVDILDTAVEEAKQAVGQVVDDVVTAYNAAMTAQTEAGQALATANQAAANVGQFDARITANTTNIATNTTAVATINTKLGTIGSTSVAQSIAALSTADAVLSNRLIPVENMKAQYEDWQPDAQSAISVTNQFLAGYVDQPNAPPTLLTQLNTIKADIATNSAKIGNVGGTSLQNQIVSVESSIQSNSTAISTINTKIGTVGGTSLQTQITTLNTTLNAKVDALWFKGSVITVPVPVTGIVVQTTGTLTGFGTSLINTGIDNRNPGFWRLWKITIPDQGFDVIPVFTSTFRLGASGQIAGTALRNVFGPVLIGQVTQGSSGVTGYNYTETVATNGRTTFLFEIGIADSSTELFSVTINVTWFKQSY